MYHTGHANYIWFKNIFNTSLVNILIERSVSLDLYFPIMLPTDIIFRVEKQILRQSNLEVGTRVYNISNIVTRKVLLSLNYILLYTMIKLIPTIL